MRITFKLYASLMKLLPVEARGHAVKLDVEKDTTLQEIIDRFSIDEKQAFLVMVNGVYIPPEQRKITRLNEQDVIAIWPKVAGG